MTHLDTDPAEQAEGAPAEDAAPTTGDMAPVATEAETVVGGATADEATEDTEELAADSVPSLPPIDALEFFDRVSALPPADAAAALAALASERQGDAVPALGTVALKAEPDLALKAMDTLVSLRSEEAATALAAIGASRDDAQKAKEARRALHKLSLVGIKPGQVPIAPRPEPEPDKVYATMASPIDGEGTRSMTIVRQNRFGSLRLGVFMLNETLGITDAYGADPCSMSLWKRYLAESNERMQKLVPAELAFCQEQIENAAARNDRSHTPLPERYYMFYALAAGPSEKRQRPPELAIDAVRANSDLLAKSSELYKRPECNTWLFDPEDLHSYTLRVIAEARREGQEKSELKIMDLGKVQREGAVVSMAINEMFDGARRANLQERLEYTADILWRSDRVDEAAWAVAAALALAPESTLPVDQHPFVREMMIESLELALELEQERGTADDGALGAGATEGDNPTQAEEYVDSQGLVRRKSGLVLPR